MLLWEIFNSIIYDCLSTWKGHVSQKWNLNLSNKWACWNHQNETTCNAKVNIQN